MVVQLGGLVGCAGSEVVELKDPVIVYGTDGVGTKVAGAVGGDNDVATGRDCVVMCVNDILALGAEPLYFLDYVATGKNEPTRLENVVKGVADGCVQGNMALIGGETAEMPGMYSGNDYDLAGFAVGIAEKSQLFTGETIKPGDVWLG
ncbi:phosphoribosylformylglycinamidine cyclo-ligase, partial [Enterococcus lactis]|nr:phosphoribosylformylglycinamidine cyclo-ligase [Enterococcus lactis]